VTPVVIDASAGVEILANTAHGRRLARLLPTDAVGWVPEHFYVEVGECSVSPAQTTQDGIRQHEPDSLSRPLKVAARVRIPYGLPRSTRKEPLLGVALSVPGLRCPWRAQLGVR